MFDLGLDRLIGDVREITHQRNKRRNKQHAGSEFNADAHDETTSRDTAARTARQGKPRAAPRKQPAIDRHLIPDVENNGPGLLRAGGKQT